MGKVSAKVRRLPRRLRIIRDFETHAHWRRQPITPNTVLYESFSGNGMLCNPEAIFQALLAAPDMQHLTHIWALSDFERYRETIRRYSGRPNVRFVRMNSTGYYRALATSQYLVNNATFPPQFGKRDGQTYVNTWHGTPLKKMGYDIEGGGPETRNVIRNFVQADYLVSGSEFMTKQMYETAYKLRNIYEGAILQEGFPRIDRQYVSDEEAAALRAELRSRGVVVDDAQKIILYAPTWKGNSFYKPSDDAEELLRRVRELNERIDTTQWRVLLRVHQQVYQYAADHPELREILVPNEMPANLALGVSEVLISDYSSIFYDFLATGRPILFYVPDLADYSDYRGLYETPDEWPGPVTDSLDELAGYLNDLGEVRERFAARYEKQRAEYCPKDDGHASERLVDVVFRGKRDGCDVRTDFSDGREKILVYLGGLRTNGINTSMLNLLDNIDQSRFDVSAFYSYRRRTGDRVKNEGLLNPNVRLFPYIGGINGSKRYTYARRRMLAHGIDASRINVPAQRRMFADEWRRVFGASRFDYIVDFSGYGPFFPLIMLEGQAKSHSIWMHNDVAADRMRETNGKRHLERGLGSVFSLYKRFDKLVSVSPALCEINKSKLAGYAGDAEFTSAVNTINYRRILELAEADVLAEAMAFEADAAGSDDEGPVAGEDEELSPEQQAKRLERQLARQQRAQEWRELLERLVNCPPDTTTFVTVGRLSPEKNHDRMIRAFAQVHAENPKTRLIIISDGPLRANLDALIEELAVTDSVIMAGQHNNPYAIMKSADCFVMSSDYEGQPMVILEARVLGLPVVSTDFASVRGSLPEGVGLVVPRSVEGMADGLRAMLAGTVPNPPFDYEAYNRDAVDQFYRVIGAID
jgi:CDP-glycerol glycerophosphotransferase